MKLIFAFLYGLVYFEQLGQYISAHLIFWSERQYENHIFYI